MVQVSVVGTVQSFLDCRRCGALFVDDEPGDRETAGRAILGREGDPPDVADIDWTAEFRLGWLEVRVRLHVVEGDADRLPHTFLQIGPVRVNDAVAIEE
jgi:hypothetical protein